MRTRHAQLLRKLDAEAAPDHDQRALDVLLAVRIECDKHVADIKAALDEHLQTGRGALDGREEVAQATPSLKGKERALSVDSSAGDDGAGLSGVALEEHRTKTRALRQRLRESYVAQHKVLFLLGDVYHSLGAETSQAEDAAYQAAEELRKTLLQSA